MLTLAIERNPTALMGSRTAFAAAILLTLSAFAKETATVILDLPKPHLAHTGATAGVAPTPVFKAPVRPRTRAPFADLRTGFASWYGKVLDNHRTASGRRFHMFELTAAHRSLPFGSKVKVTDLRNRKSVIVTITDRGIIGTGRIIALSYAAAAKLDMLKSGVDPVRLDVLTPQEILLADAEPLLQP